TVLTHHLRWTVPATPDIYTLSLHDALPISTTDVPGVGERAFYDDAGQIVASGETVFVAITASGVPPEQLADAAKIMLMNAGETRSEEHTSELQSRENLVCRLLLEKKKTYPT